MLYFIFYQDHFGTKKKMKNWSQDEHKGYINPCRGNSDLNYGSRYGDGENWMEFKILRF